MSELSAKSGLAARGFYELRDSTCEKCEVKFEHIPTGELIPKFKRLCKLLKKLHITRWDKWVYMPVIVLKCPICGGDIGRLKGRGELL